MPGGYGVICSAAILPAARSAGTISVGPKNAVRALAEQITAEFPALDYDGRLPPREYYDRLLLTAHQRVDTTT
jgi:hypothetical protein